MYQIFRELQWFHFLKPLSQPQRRKSEYALVNDCGATNRGFCLGVAKQIASTQQFRFRADIL